MRSKLFLPLVLMALVGMLLCSCNTAVNSGAFQAHTYGAKPSPYPSEQTYTARPMELTLGSQPFVGLTPQTVRSIRITISRDQPPQAPDPCKVLDIESLIKPIVTWLNGVRVEGTEAKPNPKYTPAAGSDSLTIAMELTDGSTAQYEFSSSMMYAGYTYGISSSGDLATIYESLPTPQWYAQKDGVLLSADPEKAKFYVRRASNGSIGELISHQVEKDTVLYSWVCLSPFVLGNADGRVVFSGYSGETAEQRKVVRYYSIDEQGDDLKELDIREHVSIDPVWQGDSLYYVGSSSDGDYPRPLNRANADFSRHIKVMDIPGPLVCLQGNKVYCLSQDRRSVMLMPDTVVRSYDTPIQKVIRIQAHNTFALIDADGKQSLWSPELPTDD